MIAASACLCGINCRYNGSSRTKEDLKNMFDSGKVLPICPECAGGLQIPRPPHEIVGGTGKDVLEGKAKVLSSDGEDNTAMFVSGAKRILELLKSLGISKVILKSKSPSCGVGKIYDGSFTGTLRDGNGILAELLIQSGIEVENEESFENIKKLI